MCEYTVILSPLSHRAAATAPVVERFSLVPGWVEETAGPDQHAVPTLVVTDCADERGTVLAQPVALVHLQVDDEQVQEVVCVREGMEPATFAAMCTSPDGPGRLGQAVAQAYPGRCCAVLAIEDVCCAEHVLGLAWINFLRVSLYRN